MRLVIQTVYKNMTEDQLKKWCAVILKDDPNAEDVIEELFESGDVVIHNADPNSKATKTTSFTLEFP